MKRNLLVVLVFSLAAGIMAFVSVQRIDLAADLDGVVNLTSKVRANAADSGTAVDIANYAAAAIQIATAQVDLTSTVKYIILQDSTPAVAAWVAQDSIAIDSTDNKYYDLSYKGSRRYIRILQRASGAAGDTIFATGTVVRSGARAR
jgi:hypothetical protein